MLTFKPGTSIITRKAGIRTWLVEYLNVKGIVLGAGGMPGMISIRLKGYTVDVWPDEIEVVTTLKKESFPNWK